MKKYIIFITTNLKDLVNGINRIFLGVHATENPETFDGYLGDSVKVNMNSTYMYPKTPLQYAVKKFGVKAFRRETLFIYNNINEAYNKLKTLTGADFIKQSHTYNTKRELNPNKINQFDLQGNLVKTWESARAASDHYKWSEQKFIDATKYKLNILNHYWSYDNEINVSSYNPKPPKYTYLYNLEGKLLAEFYSKEMLANLLGCEVNDIIKAVKFQKRIGDYYLSESVRDLFIHKPRMSLKAEHFYVYNKDGILIADCMKKQVFKVIKINSWKKLDKIINEHNGWYKDIFISLKPVNQLPKREIITRRVEVYDKLGNLIEVLNTVKEVKDKYNLTSSVITKILKGTSEHSDYIFKYSK